MSKRMILILEPFRKKHFELIKNVIKDDFTIEELSHEHNEKILISKLKNAEIIIGQPPIRLLQNPQVNCSNLRFIQMTWAGTDQYTRSNMKFPKEYVSLANASGAYGMIMSQFVVGMILTMMLNFKYYHTQQQEGVWNRRGPIKSLDHAKVLIYGAGDIGSAIAKRLKGFDTYTIGVCRNTEKQRPFFDELCTLKDAEKYLSDADVVIGCIPNSVETEGYLNEQRLKMMKSGAVIVNVGRGNFIDCMALDGLLKCGHLWGAALDVTNPEPLPKDHPLWSNPRCMITPHASGATFEHLEATEDLLCDIVCDNISRYCNGEEIRNRIY